MRKNNTPDVFIFFWKRYLSYELKLIVLAHGYALFLIINLLTRWKNLLLNQYEDKTNQKKQIILFACKIYVLIFALVMCSYRVGKLTNRQHVVIVDDNHSAEQDLFLLMMDLSIKIAAKPPIT